jgi:hypothetical protein
VNCCLTTKRPCIEFPPFLRAIDPVGDPLRLAASLCGAKGAARSCSGSLRSVSVVVAATAGDEQFKPMRKGFSRCRLVFPPPPNPPPIKIQWPHQQAGRPRVHRNAEGQSRAVSALPWPVVCPPWGGGTTCSSAKKPIIHSNATQPPA